MTAHQACHNFDPDKLLGAWAYVAAYTQWDDGRPDTYNFTPNPVGRFFILPGIYSHIVMSPDLPVPASGFFKALTDEEAHVIAENQLSHYGTWDADPAAGEFTVHIEKSTFAKFDGIDQVRTVTKLTDTELEYVNHTVTNGAGAVVVAQLSRIASLPGRHH